MFYEIIAVTALPYYYNNTSYHCIQNILSFKNYTYGRKIKSFNCKRKNYVFNISNDKKDFVKF